MISRALFKAEHLLQQGASAGHILGLDTGTSIASLALVSQGRIVQTINRPVPSHGAAIPGMVDEIVGRAGLSIRDLNAIAVGIGPGSFTGLRIGISYVKGLAMATGCAMAGVPSFDAIALAAWDAATVRLGALICVIFDARRGEVYAALYRVVADRLEKLSEELVVALEHLASRITEDVLIVGDSRAKDAAALLGARGLVAAVSETGTLDLRGACVAAIGGARLSRGETERSESIEPLYVRTPEATFKPSGNDPAKIGTEVLWSSERKSSFGSI